MLVEKILGLLPEHRIVYLRALKHLVSFSIMKTPKTKGVIYALDSRVYGCGFADRLRGMVSSYAYAKAKGLPFHIIHLTPFVLEDFLVPNKYDWHIKDTIKPINYWRSDMVISINSIPDGYNPFKHKRRTQFAIFTNNNLLPIVNNSFGTSYLFVDLFNELFKPSESLSNEIEKNKSYLGDNYISVSLRFIDLLGDSFEGSQNSLPEQEKESLILNCLRIINDLHASNSNFKKVLVTADSMTFLERVKTLDFVYVIPGRTGHSGLKADADVTMKTFLDFLMISYAHKVFLIKGPGMYNSHFAKSAADTQGIPFEKIEF